MIQSKLFNDYFFNRTFDKGRLKNLISWYLIKYGEHKTIYLLEELKNLGFHHATKAGISLSIDDLSIPKTKSILLRKSDILINQNIDRYNSGDLTSIERFQHMIDTWHLTSEKLKNEVVHNFRSNDTLNPVYMMAFSGARGNLSQVRQLVGMRGLMSDPQGQIIDFPISSNFREGLTLTEYVISCYGARKGIVDTALRTANSGYLTRRLVDVAQHIMISSFDCGTTEGLTISAMIEGRKTLLSLKDRLIGRVLNEDIDLIAKQNQIIDITLANQISNCRKSVIIRSPLTCIARESICQLCYGWSLAHNEMVSLGEAIGIIAAQSIGEPGTQLTMRTFHTGGVFSGDSLEQIVTPVNGYLKYNDIIPGELIRTTHGRIAFLTKAVSKCTIISKNHEVKEKSFTFEIPEFSILFVQNLHDVIQNEIIAEYAAITTQSDQRIQSKQSLSAPYEGQVFFEDVFLGMHKSKTSDMIKTAREFGSLWVLTGNVQNSKIGNSLFPKFGDLIFKNSPLSEHYLVNNINGQLYSPVPNQNNLQNNDVNSLKEEQAHLPIGVTHTKLEFSFSKIRWKKNQYSSDFKIPIYSQQRKTTLYYFYEQKVFNNYRVSSLLKLTFPISSIQFDFYTGLATLGKDGAPTPLAFNSYQKPILSILGSLTFRENASKFDTLNSFVCLSSYSKSYIEEYRILSRFFNIKNGFIAKELTLHLNSLMTQYYPNKRLFMNSFLSLKNRNENSDLNSTVFSKALVLNEWVPAKQPLIASKNRQGLLKIKSSFSEGFLKTFFLKVHFKNMKTRMTSFSIDSKDHTNNNLLLSINNCWPYYTKTNNTKLLNLYSHIFLNKRISSGKTCFDDIIFETTSVNLEITRRPIGLKKFTNNNFDPDDFKSNNSLVTDSLEKTPSKEYLKKDLLTEVYLHLLTYSKSKTKTLWFKKQKNGIEFTNDFSVFKTSSDGELTSLTDHLILINPVYQSNLTTHYQNFNFSLTDIYKFKNFEQNNKISIFRYIKNDYLTIYNEIIFNTQFCKPSSLQLQPCFITLSFFINFFISQQLHFLNIYIPVCIIENKHKKNNHLKLNQTSQIQQLWIKQFLFLPKMNFLNITFFNAKLNLQKNYVKNELITSGQKNSNNSIVFLLKKLDYVSKDQLFAKRQTLNTLTGEIISVKRENRPSSSTTSFHEVSKSRTSGELASLTEKRILMNDITMVNDKIFSSQVLCLSKMNLVCYDISNPKKNILNWSLLFGSLIRKKQRLVENKTLLISGQIISIRRTRNKFILIVRKGDPFLFSSRAVFHTFHNDLIKQNNLLLTLFYRRLQTGDIVQGIPKIEELFEARSSKFGELLVNSVPVKLKNVYENLSLRMPPLKAVRQSIQIIQQYLVDSIQQVYQSQGVNIADKHLEIIIRQMTSKVKILDGGQTGFLPGELVSLETIELINQGIDGPPAKYEPILLGITKASLETKSFISAASFQETTRILARAAVERKTDFLKGLKENIILGHLIPAGTGFRQLLSSSKLT